MTTSRGRSVPLTGQIWIEPHTGRVWRTTLRFANERARVEGAYDVTYRASAGLDVLLPDRFWEWLRTPDPEARGRLADVEGQASYTNIRRFAVSTEERLK